MSVSLQEIEKLGVFYLGRDHDLASGQTGDIPLLYDAKDLTTHAVCVGMTGSGKTGLCVSLLEEAAIDGVPAIAIDPKGDLGNLFLTFPELRPEDFRPWVDESAAERQGQTPDDFAAKTAEMWRTGLAKWGQNGERIARFRDAVDLAIYTPGSTAGLPISVLRSFDAPPREFIDDADALRERIASAASGLLALLDIDADPVLSREHILISNLLEHAWRGGKNLSLADLIRGIQEPPFAMLGVIDIETFFPSKDRIELSLRLNNLLASPAFATWMEGEQLDVARLLYTREGKPRLSIMSIAHLSDAERMFFVTILLNEVLAWTRRQSGTSSLRALVYMDEVFGYFPPTAQPPSKKPMLTLLKQARAFGVGIVLATQNPVDLDYKGLSNTGTWFLGRLQTERDKRRVLEGLEGASASAGSTFDRSAMEATLAGLGKRVFLMNNVHEDAPTVFHTRWALSYLAGPLTRLQIQRLMADRKPPLEDDIAKPPQTAAKTPLPTAEDDLFADLTPVGRTEVSPPSSSASSSPKSGASRPASGLQSAVSPVEPNRPILSSGLDEVFLPLASPPPAGTAIVYRPALVAAARLHFVKASCQVDHWESGNYFAPLDADCSAADLWKAIKAWPAEIPRLSIPPTDNLAMPATYGELPDSVRSSRGQASCQRSLKNTLYRSESLAVFHSKELKQYSAPGESEAEFRGRLRHQAVEERDEQFEKYRDQYGTKIARLQQRIKDAEARVRREEAQFRDKQTDSTISTGTSILGALFGRKLASRTNVSRAGSSLRKMNRTSRERADVERAEDKLEDLQDDLNKLEAELQAKLRELQSRPSPDQGKLATVTIRPRKSDIGIEQLALLWTPWVQSPGGDWRPCFVTESVIVPK